MRSAVAISVCRAIIQTELAGYAGFPNTEAGEMRFARALQEVSASVAHANAICARFTVKFPTVQDILDTGLNLLPQFEIQHSDLVAWEREYGPPSPARADFQPVDEPYYIARDKKIKEYLILKRGGKWPGWAKISWLDIFEAQEAIGYPLTTEQARMIGR
jgi:hypothetical protein